MATETEAVIAKSSNQSARFRFLLAMAMFVLVIDTSMMNVSISAIVRDIGATVSGVRSAIALEALVSASFILTGSKIGDLYGRKRPTFWGCSDMHSGRSL
jgi:MFS family permease